MKICIAHFRIGLTDGVSLEIEKRVKIMQNLGHKVVTIAQANADLNIDYFAYKSNPDIVTLQKAAFSSQSIIPNLQTSIEDIALDIEKSLNKFYQKEKFSYLWIHNIFSLPVCLPATVAFYRFLLVHPEVIAITVHHDFYFDPARENLFKTKNNYVQSLLDTLFPPKLPNLIQTVISKWEQQTLLSKKNINSAVITDTFDFNQPTWLKNASNQDFLHDVGVSKNDIIFLLAARIRERKGIELAIDFVDRFIQLKPNIIGKQKYNGQQITAESQIVLLLPGEFTDKEEEYVTKLKQKAANQNIEIKWISQLIGSTEEKMSGKKKYSLWDCYQFSDMVLYPSLWEGWGNQFIEAVFAKKPIVVFEYPVFMTDIKPAGFRVISLGNQIMYDEQHLAYITDQKILDKAVHQMQNILTHKETYQQMVNQNFDLGSKTHNTDVQLKQHIQNILNKKYEQ